MQKIGIIVAMEEEREAIQKLMTDIKIEEIYNLEFIIGKIGNKKCILVESGIGKVNAGRTTQILIDKYKPDSIINAGAAGAVNQFLEIGDIIISEQVVQHDFDITAFGHSKGYITGIGKYIKSHEEMLTKFKSIIDEMSKEISYKIKIGIVASGDIFCTDIGMKNKINSKFNADVVDMECAAIAQVAYLNNVPFISIRSVSDIPNGKNASTFDDNIKLASKRSANLVKKYCL